VAVAVTLRSLGDESAARAALPFLVLFPGAIWIGVSADGLFTGVAAGALALLATGLTRGARWRPATGGAGLAVCAFLSYGLILLVLPAAAVVAVRARRLPMLVWALLGAGLVVATMSALGFNWWDGYHLVKQRYYQGLASARPYAYWIWGNLAALILCAGPLAAALVRRAAASVRTTRTPAVLLCLGGAAAVLAADLSGLSKAETERIWLPFAIWLPAAAALLPVRDRRGWLCLQAATALIVNHLVLTIW
jgi:methylthioxylose transferase